MYGRGNVMYGRGTIINRGEQLKRCLEIGGFSNSQTTLALLGHPDKLCEGREGHSQKLQLFLLQTE